MTDEHLAETQHRTLESALLLLRTGFRREGAELFAELCAELGLAPPKGQPGRRELRNVRAKIGKRLNTFQRVLMFALIFAVFCVLILPFWIYVDRGTWRGGEPPGAASVTLECDSPVDGITQHRERNVVRGLTLHCGSEDPEQRSTLETEPTRVDCPEGSAVIGFEGREGDLVDQIRPICADAPPHQETLSGGRNGFRDLCPSGTRVSGVELRVREDRIHGLRMLCALAPR